MNELIVMDGTVWYCEPASRSCCPGGHWSPGGLYEDIFGAQLRLFPE